MQEDPDTILIIPYGHYYRRGVHLTCSWLLLRLASSPPDHLMKGLVSCLGVFDVLGVSEPWKEATVPGLMQFCMFSHVCLGSEIMV